MIAGLGEPIRTRGRKEKGEVRRLQLIDATISTLAKRGFSDTTMVDIAKQAGLSHGIINFHFETKDKLLVATLEHMADEYAAHWRRAIENAGDGPAAQLKAMVLADFDSRICSKRKLAAWCAFWGEARSRPTYKALCSGRDDNYQNHLTELCGALLNSEANDEEAHEMALALGAMLDGLWLHMMFAIDGHPTREDARSAALAFLSKAFPQHY